MDRSRLSQPNKPTSTALHGMAGRRRKLMEGLRKEGNHIANFIITSTNLLRKAVLSSVRMHEDWRARCNSTPAAVASRLSTHALVTVQRAHTKCAGVPPDSRGLSGFTLNFFIISINCGIRLSCILSWTNYVGQPTRGGGERRRKESLT